MKHENRAELVELGLSPTEAQIYLALLQGAALSASAIATATGLSRTAVYQILCNLSDKGLIESGAGYGTKFAVISPERALRGLIAREEEVLAYDGDLPHKLAIFDSEIVLMPLIRPNEQTKTVLIRHPQLAQSLTVTFNHFWEQSQPIASTEKPKSSDLTTARNGHQRLR